MAFATTTMKFKQNLRRLREDRGYTQAIVAEKLNWSESKYSRVEDIGRNGSAVSIDDATALANIYDLPPVFLFDTSNAALYSETFLTSYEFIEGYVQGKWTLNEVRHRVKELYTLMNKRSYNRYITAINYLMIATDKPFLGLDRLNRVLKREEEFDLNGKAPQMLKAFETSIDP